MHNFLGLWKCKVCPAVRNIDNPKYLKKEGKTFTYMAACPRLSATVETSSSSSLRRRRTLSR